MRPAAISEELREPETGSVRSDLVPTEAARRIANRVSSFETQDNTVTFSEN
jgi:hypothetical protein